MAQTTGLPRAEADEFIKEYFEQYQGIQRYIAETKELARSQGYVSTLLGRRRYLPDINSGNRMVRAAAERMAINMPLQGTAADVIKIAMIRILDRMHAERVRSKLLLQVHDELIFEVPAEEMEAMRSMVLEIMPGGDGVGRTAQGRREIRLQLGRTRLARLTGWAKSWRGTRLETPTRRPNLARIADFVSRTPDPFHRDNAEGHLTASAFILSSRGDQVVLMHHRKLDRWLQPGGHGARGERDASVVALREAREETGIEVLRLHNEAPRPVDVDVHEIPAREGEPAPPTPRPPIFGDRSRGRQARQIRDRSD